MVIKILNLYAGIGGNRKLWDGDIEVTAVENVPEIAKIYQDFFPNDKVIIADAHQYLLEHFKEFDFIWSSPPCPSHSDIRRCGVHKGQYHAVYPDMNLYQEIILLKHFAKKNTKWVVENVKPYYDLLIEGKPTIILTIAEANPKEELLRRYPICHLDESIDQTKEILKRQAEFSMEGRSLEYDPGIKEALSKLKRVKVKVPYAGALVNIFPTENTIVRTHFPRFLDFISASTALHQFQRKKDNAGFLIAEGQDYDIARECFQKITSNKYMIPLTINQKKILQIFESHEGLEGSIAQLHAGGMNFVSDRSLAYNLSLLASYGILETFPELNEQNKTVEKYKMCGIYKKKEELIIPTYQEICQSTSLPSEPSTPSLTSSPSLPNKNGDFGEVAKVAKGEIGNPTEEDLQIMGEFEDD